MQFFYKMKNFYRYQLNFYLTLSLLSCSLFYKVNNTFIEEKPNIVWLVSEDNSKHFLRLYDDSGAPMPNIEALAQKGIRFNHAFSNAPVCSVARSTIISGCYAPRVGTQYHRKMEFVPLPEGLDMFPSYLRKAGYYTSNNAKTDYNFEPQKGVWDESSNKASYQNRKKDQPFFHVQNFGTTHEGQLHFSKEEMLKNPILDQSNIAPFPYHPATEIFKYTYSKYRQLHEKVDTEIGKFIEQLKDDGLYENTIIFYYGDHGGVLPRSKGYVYESGVHVPLIVYIPPKWQHLTVFSPGSNVNPFVEFIDLAPTILNLAGIEIPKQMDGKPFLGKGVSQKDLEKKNSTFSYADRFDEKYDLVRAYRKDNFKYIRNYQPFNVDGLFNYYRFKMLAYQEWEEMFRMGKLNEVQDQFFKARTPEALYDLKNDPYEIRNLAKDPNYSYKLKELRYALQNKVKTMPDLSFYPESFFLENGWINPVQFGQTNKKDIEKLIEIADLSLLPFDQAKNGIEKALNSKNPWQRYWGLIVCSTFGNSAHSFYTSAHQIASTDIENLVRVRALEFLMLNDQLTDGNLLVEVIGNAKSEAEANLILNTVALLKTVKSNFKINLEQFKFNPDWLDEENDLVKRRMDFLSQ